MKKIFLFIAIILLISCKERAEYNFYRYEIYGSTDNYEVTFKDVHGDVHELKDVGNSTIYEFASEKANVYFSAQSISDGYVIITIFKNGNNIRSEYTDGCQNRIIISGEY